jgi:hypothetical protein
MMFSIQGDGSNQDIIEPVSQPQAGSLLSYLGSGNGGSVKVDGDYRSVVFGFGFEDVLGGSPVFNEPSELMEALVTWFTGTPGVRKDDKSGIPRVFQLYPCYPNPFNPTTTIRYQLPRFSRVQLSVYDVAGRKVVELVRGKQLAGTYEAAFDASDLTSGIYLYRLIADDFTATGKMLLLK